MNLTNFEWDKVCYVGAYTSIKSFPLKETIEKYKLNKQLQEYGEDAEYLIFVNNDKREGFVFIPHIKWLSIIKSDIHTGVFKYK